MEPRTQFEKVLAARKEHGENFTELSLVCDARWTEVTHIAWKEHFPGKKYNAIKCSSLPCIQKMTEEHSEFVEQVWKTWDTEKCRLDQLLNTLASQCSVAQSDEWTLYEVVDERSYASQGWGSLKYATQAAESIADHARFHQIPVRVELTRETPKSFHSLEVYVQASVTDCAILRRKSGPSLREQVRLCWKRGVNPRVSLPFLPCGYEEKEGLDFFGNEVSRPHVVKP